jgi:hypothetical protein
VIDLLAVGVVLLRNGTVHRVNATAQSFVGRRKDLSAIGYFFSNCAKFCTRVRCVGALFGDSRNRNR